MSAPSRSWKGPAPELVNVMHELFDLFNSNYWILVFALPGMSRDDALGVVSNIICKATIEKGKGAMINLEIIGAVVEQEYHQGGCALNEKEMRQ